jgi:hypothetical protein
MVTDSFGESTSLMCEFCYRGGADRHALMVLRDLAWHGAASSLSAVYLDDSDAGETAAAARWAGRLGADLREIPPAEAAGALRAGVDAFLRHGRRRGRIGSPRISGVRAGWSAWRGGAPRRLPPQPPGRGPSRPGAPRPLRTAGQHRRGSASSRTSSPRRKARD